MQILVRGSWGGNARRRKRFTHHRYESHEDVPNDTSPFDRIPQFGLDDLRCFRRGIRSHKAVERREGRAEAAVRCDPPSYDQLLQP